MKANYSLLLSLFISVVFFIIGVLVLLTDPMSYMNNFNFSGDPATYNTLLSGRIIDHRWVGGILFAAGSFGIISSLQKFHK